VSLVRQATAQSAERKRLTWSELLPEYNARMHAIGETVKLFLSGKKECELALTPVWDDCQCLRPLCWTCNRSY
jgi:hypothetical protein